MGENSIEIFRSSDGNVQLDVQLEEETVWLTQAQMVELFERDQSVISRHLRNVFKEDELDEKSNMQKMHIANSDKPVAFYSLDVIISVGYRVKSQRGTQFRQWATRTLKDHLVKGYTLSQKRLEKNLDEFEQAVGLVRQTLHTKALSSDESRGLLEVITGYAKTWLVLQRYDEDILEDRGATRDERFILDDDEAKAAISELKSNLVSKKEATELFGNEKADELSGIIRNIYQTFDGNDLLPSVEEKAANLLYYIIKDHPFTDGNKRIGSFLFILFLAKNGILYRPNGEQRINDNAMAALALLVAQSDPGSKELMIRLVVNLLGEETNAPG